MPQGTEAMVAGETDSEKPWKEKAIHALNGIVFAGGTVGTSEWSTEGMTSDCGTLSGKSRVQVAA